MARRKVTYRNGFPHIEETPEIPESGISTAEDEDAGYARGPVCRNTGECRFRNGSRCVLLSSTEFKRPCPFRKN